MNFRTDRLIQDAVKNGESARKEQRRTRQDRVTAAFVNKQKEYQDGCSAAMVSLCVTERGNRL